MCAHTPLPDTNIIFHLPQIEGQSRGILFKKTDMEWNDTLNVAWKLSSEQPPADLGQTLGAMLVHGERESPVTS